MFVEDSLNFKQILGILAIVIGIALLIFVFYGKNQIEIGKGEISSAKQKVKQGNKLFSWNPISKQIGEEMTSGAQKKIAAGELTIEEYEKIFMWCQTGGIVLIVVGSGLILFCRTPKRRSR